jgi:hypothetical protein
VGAGVGGVQENMLVYNELSREGGGSKGWIVGRSYSHIAIGYRILDVYISGYYISGLYKLGIRILSTL